MARPKYEVGDTPARKRLEEAFWELLAQRPVAEITVGVLCTQAHCNRGTFYYYFESVQNMVELTAVESLPGMLSSLVRSYLAGLSVSVELDEEARRNIKRICLLVSRNSTPSIVQAVQDALTSARLADLGLTWDDLDAEGRIIVAFLASGVVGVLSQCAGSASGEALADIDRALSTIFETFTKPALDQLRAVRSL